MMKIKLFVLIALISVTFSSCEKEIPMNTFTKEFTIWNWVDNNPYFIGNESIPELTQNVVDNGVVQLYYYPNPNYGGFQIPSSWSIADDVTIFLETAIREGEVEIQLSTDDWDYLESVNSLNFKIVIMAKEEF